MPKKVIVLLAEGFEEVEAITPIDYLRRAGLEVTTAAVGASRIVTGSHGIPVTADAVLPDLLKAGKAAASAWDAVLIPGGMPGAANLAASTETGALLKEMAAAAGKIVAAICASPAVVLAPLGILAGRRFTCYPGMEEKVSGARWSDDKVVIDSDSAGGSIITSRGAGTAAAFAIAVIGKLVGEAEGKKIAASVLL
ncbi:DJ-1 family protein [Spirochaetia bacterium]|nr:DJ-1 family protein [Spirochaetia bacterium]